MHGLRATCIAQGRRAVLLSGGELTVTLRGKGRGGPNQEYLLALAIALDGTRDSPRSPPTPTALMAALAPPPTRPAPSSTPAPGNGPAHFGLDPAAFLNDNNSTNFFASLGDLLSPGPTCTNVNDFRAILVDSA